MNRKELKAAAKSQIKGQILVLFLVEIVIALVSLIPNCIPMIGSLVGAIFLAPALSIAYTRIYLGVADGKKADVSDVFGSFKDFWISFKVIFFVGLFEALWSLLFIIPGIIKSFSYMLAPYIIAEDPSVGALEAITRSRKMMDGHKMEAFVLGLSFIGWYLLIAITFGLAGIYAIPYINTTVANFYNKVNTYNKYKPADEEYEATASAAASAE